MRILTRRPFARVNPGPRVTAPVTERFVTRVIEKVCPPADASLRLINANERGKREMRLIEYSSARSIVAHRPSPSANLTRPKMKLVSAVEARASPFKEDPVSPASFTERIIH